MIVFRAATALLLGLLPAPVAAQQPAAGVATAAALLAWCEANPQARLKDFISAMGEPQAQQEMEELRTRVCSFCSAFDTVGFDKDDMRYKLE